jgi:hypothetical protein
VEEEGHILGVVVGLVRAGRLLARLARVDALEDAEAPELGELQLQALERLVAREVLRGVAGEALRAREVEKEGGRRRVGRVQGGRRGGGGGGAAAAAEVAARRRERGGAA